MTQRILKSLLFLLLVGSDAATAQGVTSSVKGTITDSSGAVVPGAVCTLTDQATRRTITAKSWQDGSFTFPNVPPGTYTLRIEASGFKALSINDLVVSANEVRTVGTLILEVGEIKETVSVRAEATTVALQLASGERSGLVSGEQLQEIALKGRDFWAMLATLPGVVDDYSQERETVNNMSNRGTYINGGRANSKNYSLDGIYSLNTSNATTVVQPNLDAIAEVKVLTTNYQAEYGRMSSGVISVVTKSGTREFRGSAWYNYRHEQLNANSFFNNARGTPKSPYRYRIYGYSLGGPVYIPRRFNAERDKLFFFFSQEFSPITRDYGTQLATTPTELERAGNFSRSFDLNGALIVIRDPASGQPFPGNIIPAARFSKVGQSILSFFPLPNYTDPDPRNRHRYNLRSTYSAKNPLRNETLRLDYNPLPKLSIYYRLARNIQTTHPAWGDWKIGNNFLLTSLDNEAPGTSHLIQTTTIFSPTFVNEARFAYTLNDIKSDYTDRSKVMRTVLGNPPQVYGDPGSPDVAPDVSFGSVPANAIRLSLGPGNWYWRGTQFTYADSLSKVWDRHSLKAGFHWDYYRAVAMDTRAQWRGAFDFARDINNPFDANHGFANALLGNFSSYTELTKRALKDTVLNVIEFYVQDNWRLSKHLTLDVGLRTVSQPPEYDRGHNAAHFNPAFYQVGKSPALYYPGFDAARRRVGVDPVSKAMVPAALIGMFVPGTGDPANGSRVGGVDGYPRGLFTRSWIFPAPRVGFAYDVMGKGRTVVRGGFGIFYDTADANSFETSVGNPPISYIPLWRYGNLATLGSGSGLIGPSTMSNQAAIGRLPLPMVMNFSLGIQHQTAHNVVFDIAYVGSESRHLLMTREINPIPMYARFDPRNGDPTSPGRPLPDNFFRYYYGYGSITPYEMTGTSHYNSLQVSVNRRLTRGLQFGVAYTFSKNLGATGTSSYFPVRQRNYGLWGNHRPHVFVANYMYELPSLGKRLKFPLAAWVLDGWHVSGITSLVSGAPFTPGFTTTDGQDITGSSEGARIDVIGNPHLNKSERTFYRNFNTAAFARPALRSFGNAGVSILRGPGVNNWDVAIAKRIPLRSEKRYLRFRAEFFNAWNHTQFSGLDTTARFDPAGAQVNPTFGAFTSARPPRIIQLTARLVL